MTNFASRAAMVPVTRRVRAYFAPFDFANGRPAIFDPGKEGLFPLEAPPAPWLDLGWIDNFHRVSLTRAEAMRAGARGATAAQFRGPVDARVEFDFRHCGKLQMALAGGSEHMNVLAPDPNSLPLPSGGAPLPAVPVLAGSTPGEVVLGPSALGVFSPGEILAIDADYQQQTGYVGSGMPGAYVVDPAAVNQDANYIRRVTFNVGRVARVTATSVLLAQPLLAGAPEAGWGVQQVIAFVDREGGALFQEWSALFVYEEEAGGRICFYYPRLSPATSMGPPGSSQAQPFEREQIIAIAQPISAIALHAQFIALPHTDENDGQVALCYRSYFPATAAALY